MSYMKDYVIFLGEQIEKQYPEKEWDECMVIATNNTLFESHMGPEAKYRELYLQQRRCAHA